MSNKWFTVTLALCDTERRLALRFRLYNNSAVKKFVTLWASSTHTEYESMVLHEYSPRERVEYIEGLRHLWLSLQDLEPPMALPRIDLTDISQDKLNVMHAFFERTITDPGIVLPGGTSARLDKLNELIHIVESFLSSKWENDGDNSYFSVTPVPILQMPLEDSDVDLMEANLYPGRLYMGYHTVGKNFLHAFWENDLRIVRAKRIVPQTQASTEVVCCLSNLGQDAWSQGEFETEFFKWWDLNDIDALGYDRADRRFLALGWLPLGMLEYDSPSSVLREFRSARHVVGCHLKLDEFGA